VIPFGGVLTQIKKSLFTSLKHCFKKLIGGITGVIPFWGFLTQA